MSTPYECLSVNVIGPYPYTLEGRDNLQIDFMALTMMDPASSVVRIECPNALFSS